MITKTTGFQVGDRFFTTLDEAKEAALVEMFERADASGNPEPWPVDEIAEKLRESAEAVIDILTTGPKSRPKARKINKPKTTKPKIVRHEAERFELPKIIEKSETGA